jgi:hypothetical protein
MTCIAGEHYFVMRPGWRRCPRRTSRGGNHHRIAYCQFARRDFTPESGDGRQPRISLFLLGIPYGLLLTTLLVTDCWHVGANVMHGSCNSTAATGMHALSVLPEQPGFSTSGNHTISAHVLQFYGSGYSRW